MKNKWKACLVGAVLLLTACTPEEQPPVQETATTEIIVPVHVTVIEEPVIESTPVREDIPLDAETQLQLYQACNETGVPCEVAIAVVWKETNFRNINGDGGKSIGYMQVQPRWHSERMERLGVSDLADPYGNFLVGCDYLAELIQKDRGLEWALHAYNGGPTYANKMAKAEKVSKYAESVLNYMNTLGGN